MRLKNVLLKVIHVFSLINNSQKKAIKNALMLKLYFYTRFFINPTRYDVSWSPSQSQLTSIKHMQKH